MVQTFTLAAVALLFAGCCVAERCDCRDQRADTLALRFSRDSVGGAGFRAAEIDTFYLVRLPLDTLDRPRRDSVRLTTTIARTDADFTIDQRGPFASNPRKAGGYRYLVRGTQTDTFTVRLTEVQVSGHLRTESACCTCYENTRKTLRVNDEPPLDLHTAAGNQPAIGELRKP